MVFCDNISAIDIAKNPVYHSKTCHIAIKHYFVRDTSKNDEVELKFYKSESRVANIFIKALPKGKFSYFQVRHESLRIAH